jgi:hypothetical protein
VQQPTECFLVGVVRDEPAVMAVSATFPAREAVRLSARLLLVGFPIGQ